MNPPLPILPIKTCFFVWICLCPFSFAESLRIATYNLNNYFLTDRMAGSDWRPHYPKPESEKSMIRQVIREADPDVLALQEIGSLSFLRELQADLAVEGSDYPYAVHLEAADARRQIALLSKLEPQTVLKHVDLRFNYQSRPQTVKRGLLEVAFSRPDGAVFKLFVVHLKSRHTVDKADPEARLRRRKEAEACRDRIIERTVRLDKPAFMILGDFNDHPESPPLRRFHKRGDLKIASLLPAADSRGGRWTYYYSKETTYSLFDGILISEATSDWIPSGRGWIADPPGALDGSDHRMVYVDIQWPEVFPRPNRDQNRDTSVAL